MKPKTTLLALALSALSLTAQAQRTPTHPMDISTMDFSEWIDAFLNWTEGNPLGKTSKMDDEFYISRVKPRQRIAEADDYQAVSGVDRNRKMCLWTPLDDPTSTWKGFPRYCFEGDNFSMWSYMDIHGNWTAPWARVSAGLSDVAAKNGVKVGCVLSIPWDERISLSWGSNKYSTMLIALTRTNSSGEYRYSKKLVEFMKYYGINGLGVNSEFRSNQSSMNKLIGFFKDCHKKAKEIGWDFQLHWYDFTGSNGQHANDRGLGSHNSDIFGDGDNIVTDMLFFNYNWYDALLRTSVTNAGKLNRSSYDLYAGFDIQGRALTTRGGGQSWQALANNKISIGFWGAHSQGLLHQSATDDGTSDIAIQKAYLQKQELVFSGGYRNPACHPNFNERCNLANASLRDFHGLAALLTAKSTITTVPFVSRFNLGNGLKFRNEGKVTFDHKWYNLNTQDIMPTWRWWITDATDVVNEANKDQLVKADLTFDDAYFGGSCLSLHGKTDFSRVKLFKTMLEVQSDYTLSITYKMPKDADTHAKLFVALKDDLSSYKEVAIPTDASKQGQWVTFTTTMNDLGVAAGSKVAMLGISVNNTPADYQMLVGELALRNPGQTFNTVTPKIEEIQPIRGRYNALDFKIRYSSDNGTTGTKVYNDDVDTWYYEIYFQQKDKEEQLLTATTSWAAYVIDAPLVSGMEGREARYGVRAVSPDGLHKSPITWSEYQSVPYNQPLNNVVVDRMVVKPGEEFLVKMEDEMILPAKKWEITNPLTETVVASSENSPFCKASIAAEGLYDLHVTGSDGKLTTVRGKIQVTPNATGSVPSITNITVDKANANTGDQVKYSYTGHDGEGKVSRGLEIKDPNMFMIPAEVQKGYTYSYALWFKADKFSHDKQGTNLINKNTVADSWPHNNWGDLWVQIRPQWKNHSANEVSFNTMGWTEHDNPNESMMSTGYQVTPGVWYHIVVTQEGKHQKLYFNGKKLKDATFSYSSRREDLGQGDSRIKYTKPANIFIGGGGVYKAGFTGCIDEVQVWDHALSDEEVLRAMKGYSKDEVPEHLKAYYTFEELSADGTFANLGHAGADKVGKVVVMANSGGESTSSASYEQKEANNGVLGYPGITGTLEVKTTPAWTLEGAVVVDNGNVATVTYAAAGKYNATLTLSNDWGEATKTVAEIVEVTGLSSGIDGVDAELGFSVYPNPFIESVNLRFAEGGNYTIQVLNAGGTLLQATNAQPTAGQVVNVAVTGGKGLYIVRVLKNGKQYKAVKVIKH